MRCPFCQHPESRVLDSRMTEEGSCIRRRRECLSCLRRFTSYERHEESSLWVVKKDKRREPFDRNKVLTGILKACEKRPISLNHIEQMANNVEREIRNRLDNEVSAMEIGQSIMDMLRHVDDVAYVRFASVYKEFTDARRFMEEVAQLDKSW
ncbi:MAG: transcriptional repressor NrdR [Armatimonadetes bacterium]|nr:transcriptional repressor NrdR [Armatimonadota bacterium]